MYLSQKNDLNEDDFCYFESVKHENVGVMEFFKKILHKNEDIISAKW